MSDGPVEPELVNVVGHGRRIAVRILQKPASWGVALVPFGDGSAGDRLSGVARGEDLAGAGDASWASKLLPTPKSRWW